MGHNGQTDTVMRCDTDCTIAPARAVENVRAQVTDNDAPGLVVNAATYTVRLVVALIGK